MRAGKPISRIALSALKIGTMPPKVRADATKSVGMWVRAKLSNIFEAVQNCWMTLVAEKLIREE